LWLDCLLAGQWVHACSPTCFLCSLFVLSFAVLQQIQAKVAAQGEESLRVLELNKALAEENELLRARTEDLRAVLDDSQSKVEALSGAQREQLEALQKRLQEQVRQGV
jgi:Skp family chaperone for outer membrane proteins